MFFEFVIIFPLISSYFWAYNFIDTNPYNSVVFFFYIYNLHFFKQKVYSHQVLIYLNIPGIPVRKPLQNRQVFEEQLDV